MQKLNHILKKTGIEIYYDILSIALYSLITSAVLLPIVLLSPTSLSLILLPVLYMPIVYGVLYVYHQKTDGKRTGVKDIFKGAIQGWVPAVVFGLLCSLLVLILVSTWWYYGGQNSIFQLAIAVFQTYFVAMVLVSQLYTLQLVLQKKVSIFRAMGESVKLFLRYPAYTLGAFFQAFFLGLLLLVTVVGLLALFNGMLAIYLHKVAHNVLYPQKDNVSAESKVALNHSITGGQVR